MGTRIVNFIKQHKLYYFLILAIIEIILYIFLKPKTIKSQYEVFNKINTGLASIGSALLLFLFIAIWVISFLYYNLNLFYKKKCDRENSLIKDVWYYKLSPFRLYSYFKTSNPYKLDITQFPICDWRSVEGFVFGYSEQGNLVYLPSSSEVNMWIFGSPGSSKTVSFVKPNTRQFGGSALVVDIKGDIYDYNKDFRNIARFAPDIPNAINESAHFNPFRNFDKLSSWELKLKIMNMAEMLIPESSKNESFFYRNGRKMFAGILLYLLYTSPDLTFPEFIHAILHHKKPKNYPFDSFPKNIYEWVECISASDCDAAIERISSMEGTNESNISGVWDEFCTGLMPFSNEILDDLLTDNGNCVSSDTLYRGKDIYLQLSQNNLKMYAPLFTMIINSFLMDFQERSDSAINRGKNRPILVVLDEFVQLTFPYNTINSYLSTLRSKSVNLCLISQNLMQVSEKYGNYGCKALLGNCTYQICCKSNDPDTIKHFQDIIGTKKVLKQGLAATETDEPIYKNSHYSALAETAIIKFDKFHTELKKIKSYE